MLREKKDFAQPQLQGAKSISDAVVVTVSVPSAMLWQPGVNSYAQIFSSSDDNGENPS
jgi:hypothetical protein